MLERMRVLEDRNMMTVLEVHDGGCQSVLILRMSWYYNEGFGVVLWRASEGICEALFTSDYLHCTPPTLSSHLQYSHRIPPKMLRIQTLFIALYQHSYLSPPTL